MIFFDTETCGLHGMPVLIQWAEDDGPIHLFSPWTEPIYETLQLIEKFCEADGIVGFNLAFDWFMISKLYTTLSLHPDWDAEPRDIIEKLAILEEKARDSLCVKPRSACDLMLFARKGPYQSTMDRGDIRIRKVPTALAYKLAAELEKRIPLSDIYFARRKDKQAPKWQVEDVYDKDEEYVPEFKDILVRFAPSSALKALAVDALKLSPDNTLLFADVEVDKQFLPTELGYAPFALAIGKPGAWNNAWPEQIMRHVNHWRFNELARKYAAKDVEYTRALYYHFGKPALGDDDSVLACAIASNRWRGYAVDIEGLKELRERTLARRTVDGVEIPTAPRQARIYIEQVMDETEKLGASTTGSLTVSTKRVLLEEIYKTWRIDCPNCKGDACVQCSGTGEVIHPAAVRAKQVLEARQANYEADLYSKFILAGRFHASFAVIGTLSSRMGGGGTARGIEAGGKAKGDGLNPQGIKKTKEVRAKFPLAFPGYDLGAGDFSGFEVTLAEAEYNDPNLRKQLLTCEKCSGEMEFVKDKNDFLCKTCGSNKGKKIHALFGVHVYPEHTYESLKKTEGTSDDKYTKAKSGIFAMMYGGTEHTLESRLGVPAEVALAALARFHKEFPGVKKSQQRINNLLGSMQQLGGIGSKITWKDPADYIESMFGFKRYFTLENTIAKTLFSLASNPPKDWKDVNIQVTRRDRVQSAMGAVQSALYGCAFSIQASNIRAANNHVIQSSGATITKTVQRRVWDLQPHGAHKFVVQVMNIHDELQCPSLPEYTKKVEEIVMATVEEFRPKVPLIKMDWKRDCKTWADKS